MLIEGYILLIMDGSIHPRKDLQLVNGNKSDKPNKKYFIITNNNKKVYFLTAVPATKWLKKTGWAFQIVTLDI